jgi:GT2 family glycosyltransferase
MGEELREPMSEPDVSIIVASYNTRDLTLQCLHSIKDQTAGVTYEVILVDDCSPDDTVAAVRSAFPDIRVLVNETNQRYAKTNNRGLREARGRYGLLLNTDTVLDVDAISALVRFMDEHPSAAAAGPKLLNPDGTIQHCIRSFPGVGVMIAQTLNLHRFWPNNPITDRYYHTDFDYGAAQPIEAIGTTAFIIRRSTWEQHGMLDERFSWAFCDQAYCLSLGRQGCEIWYVPEAAVFHLGSQSINQNPVKEIRSQHEALRRLYDIYLAERDPFWKRPLVRVGIAARRVLKTIEHRFDRDKRLIKGPGAPALAVSNSLRPNTNLHQPPVD